MSTSADGKFFGLTKDLAHRKCRTALCPTEKPESAGLARTMEAGTGGQTDA